MVHDMVHDVVHDVVHDIENNMKSRNLETEKDKNKQTLLPVLTIKTG